MADVGELGDEMRRRREALGLSQQDVAAKMGLKRSSQVSHWETGDRRPTKANLKAAAPILQTTLTALLAFGEHYDPAAPRITKRQRAAKGAIPPDDRERHLLEVGKSPRVPLTHQDSVRESEAVVLRTLSLRSWSTVTRFAALVEQHPEHELQLCQAVEAVLQGVEEHGVSAAPKAGRRNRAGA